MKNKRLTGIVVLLVVAFTALLGAAAVAQVVTPPGTVVDAGGKTQQGVAPLGPSEWPDAPGLSNISSGNVVLNADFSSDISSWQGQPVQGDEPAVWRALRGKLVQNGDSSGSWSDEEAVLLSGDTSWANYSLETQAYATSGTPVGLVWRASAAGQYRVRLFQNLPNDASKARLELVAADGTVKVLGTAPVSRFAGYELGAWQTMKVTTEGSTQRVWVNGTELFNVTDATLNAGRVGVYSTADGGSAFDNVRVATSAGAQ
jgi:hypothetical protein